MTRGAWLVIVGVAVAAFVLTMGFKRFLTAQSKLQAAQSSLQLLASDVQEVLSLRSKQQRIAIKQRPTQDVIAQVNAVLADAGIPSQRLKSLAPESDAAVNPAGSSAAVLYKRQSLRLTLENLSMPELGAFLLKWRDSQQVWTISRIELTHVRSTQAQVNNYDASLLMSAVYLDQA